MGLLRHMTMISHIFVTALPGIENKKDIHDKVSEVDQETQIEGKGHLICDTELAVWLALARKMIIECHYCI